MKSVNQIFENDKELLLKPPVMELIEYCHEMEEQIIENNQQYSFENELTELVKEIYLSVNDIIDEDDISKRFNEIDRIDYETTMKNLKKYMKQFSIDNNFRLI